jgi:hypothetical protein
MNQMLLMTLLFLPVILVAITILTIQIRGDFLELKYRNKRKPKLSVTLPLNANHEQNLHTFEMIINNYKNVEIVFLAGASRKKAIGQMKYYRSKNKLKNVRILTSKLAKQQAKKGKVKGQFVFHMPAANYVLTKNSLMFAISKLQSKSRRKRPSVGIIMLPPLNNSLKSGFYFTRNVLMAHIARSSYSFSSQASVGIVSRRGGLANHKRKIHSKRRFMIFLDHSVRWAPILWVASWVILFGYYALGAWAIAAILLVLLGFFAQFNLKGWPLHTRLSVILLAPLIVLIPIPKKV